jgi:hypothetical protein
MKYVRDDNYVGWQWLPYSIRGDRVETSRVGCLSLTIRLYLSAEGLQSEYSMIDSVMI